MKHLAPALVEEDSTEGSYGDDDDTASVSLCSVSPAAVTEELDVQNGEKSKFYSMETNDDLRNRPLDDSYSENKTKALASTPRPLKSSLRSSLSVGHNAHQAQQLRRPRVHGLWSEDETVNPFALLHDSLLAEILSSYLDLEDLCRCQCVSQRFASLARREEAWRHIDATSFVQTLYEYYERKHHRNPAEATAELLVQKWQARAPVSIRIDKIGNRLDAHSFSLPTNTKRLRSLSLSNFQNLTDTHVHVLLLSSKTTSGASHYQAAAPVAMSLNLNRINRRRSSLTHPWPLQALVLEQCPRLTNAALRSIANMCDQLQELNVSGCPLVNDLSPLKPLWKMQRRADFGLLSTNTALPLSERSMPSLLGVVGASTGTNSSPGLHVKKTANLGSIFVPPATSPVPEVAMGTAVGSLNSLFSPQPAPPAANIPPAATRNQFASLTIQSPFVESRTTIPISPSPVLKSSGQTNAAVINANLGSLFLPTAADNKDYPRASLVASSNVDSASIISEVVHSLGNSLDALGNRNDAQATASVSNSSSSLASLDPLCQQPIMKLGKELSRICVSYTGVTPDLLIRSFTEAAAIVDGNTVIALESLLGAVLCTGDHPPVVWDDSHLRALTRLIHTPSLQCLDISCHVDSAQRYSDAVGRVTDASVLSLFGIEDGPVSSGTPMLELQKLDIMGHGFITENALESIRKASIAPGLIVRR